MGKKVSIEKLLCPDADILQTDGESATAKILDAELDVINCSFNNDMCVQIETEGVSYIILTLENMKTLKKLIVEADAYYEKYFSEEHPE